jgi:hypothetical protein
MRPPGPDHIDTCHCAVTSKALLELASAAEPLRIDWTINIFDETKAEWLIARASSINRANRTIYVVQVRNS